jgi:tryptophanase
MGFIIELCRLYGIRALEIGYMSNGIDIQAEKNGGELPSVLPNNFIRMIIPANVYQ